MYQKFRNQFLSFSMYQSECLGSVQGRGGAGQASARLFQAPPPGPAAAVPSRPAGFVQFLQYYYQSGCLYRLRALGERHTMDLTVGEWAGPCPGREAQRGPDRG